MTHNQKVFSIVSALLQYPEEEWKEQLDELGEALAGLGEPVQRQLVKFLDYLRENSYEQLCQNYVYTFDFYEKATLYLTHSVFKDNRERGPILVKLREQFYESGWELTTEELPDYLPLILEFASLVPEEQSENMLKLHLRSIQNLELELLGIDSPYTHLVTACKYCIQGIPNQSEKVS